MKTEFITHKSIPRIPFTLEETKHGTPLGFLDHLVRDGLLAPNTTTMRILKERPAGKVGAFTMDFETPFIHRVRSGMQ